MGWIGLSLLGLVVLYLGVQAVLCAQAVSRARVRLEAYQAEQRELPSGTMTFVDKGEGDPILVIHGICGGYDQGYDAAAGCLSGNRIIAPSRFGYLGSAVPEDPSPRTQAKAFAELLDALGIDQAHVLATSAGGTSAIRFALDYPERVKGLILLSSAHPFAEKPKEVLAYQGPPAAICNNYVMWLVSPMFQATMGFAPSMVHGMLPLDERKDGTRIDATLSNPDMARHFEEYHIESLTMRTLILHAKDDKLASYANMEQVVSRYPSHTLVSFETGGHLISGHEQEVQDAIVAFLHETGK